MATFFTFKDPDAMLDYGIDWTNWLAPGDSISNSTWIVPTGMTELNSAVTAGTAVIFLAGGVAGEVYVVTNRITTTAGRIDDRSIEFTVIDR